MDTDINMFIDVEENDKILYVNLSHLASHIESELAKENPDYDIEFTGVKRWE